jgi:hypothetical protein
VDKSPSLLSLSKQSGTLERVPELRLHLERKTGFEPGTLILAKTVRTTVQPVHQLRIRIPSPRFVHQIRLSPPSSQIGLRTRTYY